MSLAALEPKFWSAFASGVGHEISMSDLVPGPHQAELKTKLAGIFAGRTQAEWIAFASERDCCLEPVLSPEEARDDAHLAARGMFFELDSPWGKIPQLRTPLTPRERTHAPPPKQGEHTEAVLRDAGLDEAEIAALRADGAIR